MWDQPRNIAQRVLIFLGHSLIDVGAAVVANSLSATAVHLIGVNMNRGTTTACSRRAGSKSLMKVEWAAADAGRSVPN